MSNLDSLPAKLKTERPSSFKVQTEAAGSTYCVHVCPMQPWEVKKGADYTATTAKVIAHWIDSGQECSLT